MSNGTWAASSIAPPGLLTAFQEGLPVRLIATPRALLKTCLLTEPLSDVIARNREGYDHLPVVRATDTSREQIVGLIDLVKFGPHGAPIGVVREHMESLSESNLVGADASILRFIQDADHHPCRLVVSGAQIDGLVTLSDLQKLPVRAALFGLVTQLEMTMAACIRRVFAVPDQWKKLLSESRRVGIDTLAAESRHDDSWVDDLLFTQFCDKRDILRKSKTTAFDARLFERDMRNAEKLRNELAHANEYAGSRTAAITLCETVRRMEHWIEQLQVLPAASET